MHVNSLIVLQKKIQDKCTCACAFFCVFCHSARNTVSGVKYWFCLTLKSFFPYSHTFYMGGIPQNVSLLTLCIYVILIACASNIPPHDVTSDLYTIGENVIQCFILNMMTSCMKSCPGSAHAAYYECTLCDGRHIN